MKRVVNTFVAQLSRADTVPYIGLPVRYKVQVHGNATAPQGRSEASSVHAKHTACSYQAPHAYFVYPTRHACQVSASNKLQGAPVDMPPLTGMWRMPAPGCQARGEGHATDSSIQRGNSSDGCSMDRSNRGSRVWSRPPGPSPSSISWMHWKGQVRGSVTRRLMSRPVPKRPRYHPQHLWRSY